MLNRAIGFDILADDAPGDTVRTEEVILRIGYDQGRPALNDLETGIRQSTVVGMGGGADQ